MGTSLSGLTPATTFDGLLKTSDNDALGTGLKTIGTGDGTDSVLQLSNSALHIGGSATNETTATWVEGFNSNLRLSANSPSMQFKDTSGTAGFMIGVSGASTFFSQSTNADFTAVSYVGKISGGKWNFGSSDTPTATVSVKGSGASAGTTSLLVQNSAGTELLKVLDDGNAYGSTLNLSSALKMNSGQTIRFSGSEAMRGNISTGTLDLGEHSNFTNTRVYSQLSVIGTGNTATTTALLVQNSDGTDMLSVKDDLSVVFNSTITSASSTLRFDVGGVGTIRMNSDKVAIGGNTTPTARLHIKGSGATSATTALLVQNSAGTDLLKVEDGGNIVTSGFTFQSNILKPNVNGYIGVDRNNNRTFSVVDSNATRTYLNIQSSSTSNFADVSINTDHLVVKKEGNVAVGTSTLDASAKLQVDSTTQGFLPPRMTTTERDAISTPAAGLMIYNTTTNKAQCYNGTIWSDLF